MAKQTMLFNSPQGWKKSLYSQSLLLNELKFPVKKDMVTKFCTLGSYTGKILFADRRKSWETYFNTSTWYF